MFRLLDAEEISVKVNQVKEKGVIGLLYKTARVDMDILDETVGPENWTDEYREIKGVMYCKVGIRFDHGIVYKEDCGIESGGSGEGNGKKGEASDAFKRACVRWGIGRELYSAPFIFMDLPRKAQTKNGKTVWVLADKNISLHVDTVEYDASDRIIKLIIVDGGGNAVFRHPRNAKPSGAEPKAPNEPHREDPRAMLLSKIARQRKWSEESVNRACVKKYGRNLLELSNSELAEVLILVGGEPDEADSGKPVGGVEHHKLPPRGAA